MIPRIIWMLFISFAGMKGYCQQPDSLKQKEVLFDPIFVKVEVEPEFPGGVVAWREFLKKNISPDIPKKKTPVGTYTVIVRFIVSKDGTINEVTAETRHGYGMEEEVIKLLKKSPQWIPATQNGRVVNAYRRQPVTFVVPVK